MTALVTVGAYFSK